MKRINKEMMLAMFTMLLLVFFLPSGAGTRKVSGPIEQEMKRLDDSINFYRSNDAINWDLISNRLNKKR